MWETWERARVERVEERIAKLERKNWERSEQIFRWVFYGLMAVNIALIVAAVAIGVSDPGH